MSGVPMPGGIKRPLAITIIALLFILQGAGLILRELLSTAGLLDGPAHFDGDDVWVLVSAALALAGGWLLLRGSAWGRWLILFWLAAHVVIGFLHGPEKGIIHAVLLLVIGYFLFRGRTK